MVGFRPREISRIQGEVMLLKTGNWTVGAPAAFAFVASVARLIFYAKIHKYGITGNRRTLQIDWGSTANPMCRSDVSP